MPPKLRQFIISLRVSSGIYALIAIGATLLCCLLPLLDVDMGSEDGIVMIIMGIIMAIMSIGIVIFNEFIIHFIKKGAFWAWVAGLCMAGLYIPSIFLPLGIFMLLGLIDPETNEFCKRKKSATSNTEQS